MHFFICLSFKINLLVKSTSSTPRGVRTTGRDCFITFWRRFRSSYDYVVITSDCDQEKERLNKSFANFWENDGHELAHYFRFLYNIFKFIDESGIEDKQFYSRLVRAQLVGSGTIAHLL
ncbi:putative phage abortive infection protein [Photobacterium leiognathi]|uniref:putative phage abortive infection protein n=1 Tax=Photobacterium leiognathi TaxID=553611 RepID=UPI0027399E9E|nr:putative phage abortive infection protein [Photobacterium leiognathi]